MTDKQNFIILNDKAYHERADATLKVSERDIITARYNWAIKRLNQHKARKILDVGCGLGYGTQLIANRGLNVLGIDKSETAISTCKNRYSSIAKFLSVTIDNLQDNIFDCIIAFEIIEHMAEAEQIMFLRHCAALLKPKGILLLSTPNVKYSKNRNPHHLKEFNYKELGTLFNNAKISGLVLPHLRKVLSFIIRREHLENIHLPLFRVPVNFAEYFLVEMNKANLQNNLENYK